jgi:hypothetical protein
MAQGRGKSASFKAGPILFYFKVQIDIVPLFLVLIMYS